MPAEGPGCQAHGTTDSPGGIPRLLFREKTRPARPLQPRFREKTRPARHKTPILGNFSCAGRTFSRLHDDHSAAGRTFSCSHPHRAELGENIAHEARQHGDVETNNTSAHPQQGTYETRITSAPEKHAKNTHFSPAKAMAVSIPHRHQREKATMVSNHQATWPTGPGHGARRPFRAHVNPMTCTWAMPPRRTSRGLRAHQRVNVHVQRFACEQHTAIDTESAKVQTHCLKMTDFRRLLPNGSALWRTHHLTSWPHHHQTGEMASLEPRHAGDTLTASL